MTKSFQYKVTALLWMIAAGVAYLNGATIAAGIWACIAVGEMITSRYLEYYKG